jgi:hypothetical protein
MPQRACRFFNSCGEFDKSYVLEIFGEEKKNALFKVLGFPSKEKLVLYLKICDFVNADGKLKTRAFNKFIEKCKLGIDYERLNVAYGKEHSIILFPTSAETQHATTHITDLAICSREIEPTFKICFDEWRLHVENFEESPSIPSLSALSLPTPSTPAPRRKRPSVCETTRRIFKATNQNSTPLPIAEHESTPGKRTADMDVDGILTPSFRRIAIDSPEDAPEPEEIPEPRFVKMIQIPKAQFDEIKRMQERPPPGMQITDPPLDHPTR